MSWNPNTNYAWYHAPYGSPVTPSSAPHGGASRSSSLAPPSGHSGSAIGQYHPYPSTVGLSAGTNPPPGYSMPQLGPYPVPYAMRAGHIATQGNSNHRAPWMGGGGVHYPGSAGSSNEAAMVEPLALLRTARQFGRWIKEQAPGAQIIVCGGLAMILHGQRRTTQDVDVTIDLAGTRRHDSGRPFDTNYLKGLAGRDSRNFVAGPVIYWRLNGNRLVQVDFVDAHLFWSPFRGELYEDSPDGSPFKVMTLQTLLVGKMLSSIERNQHNEEERTKKIRKDVQDFEFALVRCLQGDKKLSPIHLMHLRGVSTVSEFNRLSQLAYWPPNLDRSTWKGQWNQLLRMSQLGPQGQQYMVM